MSKLDTKTAGHSKVNIAYVPNKYEITSALSQDAAGLHLI